jgi:hypothetical protein
MWTAFELRRRASLLAFGMLLMLFRLAHAADVTLDVHVSLVDKDNVPIANAPIRLTFGSAPGWDAQGAGTTFTTDAKGEHHFTTKASLDTQLLKQPAAWVTQLISLPEKTRHLRLGAELPYYGQSWLYVADINRFQNGTNLGRAVMKAYGVDSKGRYTVPARSWGHELSGFFLKPVDTDAADATHWTVKLTFMRFPEPVQR